MPRGVTPGALATGPVARSVGCAVLVVAFVCSARSVEAQVDARPVMAGTAFVGEEPLADGVVVLHHVSDGSAGEVDSLRLGPDGSFAFSLPGAPDAARGDIFFASIRHDGVLYFGPAITEVIELDAPYEIHAYDTLVAPSEGVAVAVQGRSIFFEPGDGSGWRVTDLFQLRNDRDRTIVTRPGGRAWSYPLPDSASDVMAGEGEVDADAVSFEDGQLVVRAALPPGERLFVARYTLPTPFTTIPTPGVTETLDVLVLEPVPALEIGGLSPVDRIEVDSSAVFRRYAAERYEGASVEIVAVEEQGPLPVGGLAVLIAAIFTAAGLAALMRRPGPVPARVRPPAGTEGRQALLLEIARLDEEFATRGEAGERDEYERRRAELLNRVRGTS